MHDDQLRHLPFLAPVALADADFVRGKEETYRGSWKRAGGRSAWFMFRRNMDRLMNMMEDVPWPESFSFDDVRAVASGGSFPAELTGELAAWLVKKLTAEDIFAKIEEHPAGEDGTVLACLRDLRRYALLIEAEMVARGTVKIEAPSGVLAKLEQKMLASMASLSTLERGDQIEADFYELKSQEWACSRETARELVTRALHSVRELVTRARHSTRSDDARGEKILGESSEWLHGAPPATPSSGSQHATLTPWMVSMTWRFKHEMQPGGGREKLFDAWWRQAAPGKWVAETWNSATESPPPELAGLYRLLDEYYVIDVARCPADVREYFPSLPEETNHHELMQLHPALQTLYEWSEERGDKFVLTDRAWISESQD